MITPMDGKNQSDVEQFLTLKDVLRMVLRHKWKVGAFTVVATVVVGATMLMRPREFQAEAQLQVISMTDREGRVNREVFEMAIRSHTTQVKTPTVAARVSANLAKQGINIDDRELMRKVRVENPSRTSVINITAKLSSRDEALTVVSTWVDDYLGMVRENCVLQGLFFVRSRLKEAQENWMEKLASAEGLRKEIEAMSDKKLVTLSKALDDEELWRQVAEDKDGTTLKRLAGIQLKTEEQSAEYLGVKNALVQAEMHAAGAMGACAFYQQVINILESKLSNVRLSGQTESVKTNGVLAQVELPMVREYADALANSADIVPFGKPAAIIAPRGAAKMTVLAFVGALFLSGFAAFVIEWMKES